MIEGREEQRIGIIDFCNMDEEFRWDAMSDLEHRIDPPEGAKSARIETYELANGEVEIVKVIQW